MITFGQTLNIISGIAFLTAATLWAIGKLPIHLAFLTAIATNIIGFVGTWIVDSAWGMALHLIAIGCFTVALAAHHATSRRAHAEDGRP